MRDSHIFSSVLTSNRVEMMVGSVVSPELEKDIHEGDIKFVDVDFKYPTR